MSKFKENLDLIEKQQQEFTNRGVLLRNIFSISANHPWLSLLFILSLGLLTNALSDLANYVATSTLLETRVLTQLILLVLLFSGIPLWVYVRVRALHKDLFIPTPLNQKKVLVTIVSDGRTDFKKIPAYIGYGSLINSDTGHSAVNSLEKIVLIVTESPQVKQMAKAFKTEIEKSGRSVEVFSITINDKSILDIKRQLEGLFTKLLVSYKPYEIISDYTGGTKDISIALLKVSEDEIITPIYLKSAATNNHSRSQ